MTPAEEKWIKDGFMLLARQNVNRVIEFQVLTEVLADLLDQASGQDAATVREEIRKLVKQRQQEALLKIEDFDPGLAAWLDRDQPPQA